MERKCNTKIQQLGDGFINKLQSSQQDTYRQLSSLFESQEQSIEKKLQSSFQTLLSQFQNQPASPTRKKQTIQTEDTDMTKPMVDQNSLPNDTQYEMIGANIPIQNPYNKSILRRRNAIEALPTSQT
jgi:hypothetical protein